MGFCVPSGVMICDLKTSHWVAITPSARSCNYDTNSQFPYYISTIAITIRKFEVGTIREMFGSTRGNTEVRFGLDGVRKSFLKYKKTAHENEISPALVNSKSLGNQVSRSAGAAKSTCGRLPL